MARWDDLRRAILARDTEGTERIWLELLESGPGDLGRLMDAAQLVSKQQAGKRQAGVLLWLLIESLKEAGRDRDLVRVFGLLAGMAPDDGSVREGVIAAAEKAYADRSDLEGLFEKSGLRTGNPAELDAQIAALERYLRIEKGAYVWHKSGWGVGQIVEYYPDRGRCVIDFRERPGHEMDIEAAAKILERLPEDDIRVQAMVAPRDLRKRARDNPLDVLRQVLGWHGNAAALRIVRTALVPDAVAASTWSAWWKSAKRQALLDPRFQVGPGRDPRIELHELAESDFRSQVQLALKRSATIPQRQKVITDLSTTVGADEDARAIMLEVTEHELEKSARAPAARLGWEVVLAGLKDQDPVERLGEVLALINEPVKAIQAVTDDRVRAVAGAGYLRAREDGLADLLVAARSDDPALAEVAVDGAKTDEARAQVNELLDEIDAKPALLPNLYAWYLKRLRRGVWEGREAEPYRLVLRVLKVIDAVEYRQRRNPSPKDKKAVVTLGEVLEEKSHKLVREAAEGTDEDGARHLIQILEQGRGLRPVFVQRATKVVAGVHPGALRKLRPQQDDDAEAPQRIYMTRAGKDALRAEAKRIESEEMPANAAEIARAREFGDLSENAEYHAAREKQSMLDAKLRQIKNDVARSAVITSDIVATDAVSVGSRVQLRDNEGQEITYTLFGPPDTNVQQGIINYLTPLGQALMGRKPGEHVRLDVEGEVRELEVLGIENGLA